MEIVIRENGEMVGVGYNSNANAWFRTHGPVPSDDPRREALEVGRKVLRELGLHPGRQLREMNTVGSRKHHIVVYTAGIAPPEPVGVEFLRQLKSCVVYFDRGFHDCPFVIAGSGLVWIGEDVKDTLWAWDGSGRSGWSDWREEFWVQNASSDTIKPWTPEENNDADKYPENRPCL